MNTLADGSCKTDGPADEFKELRIMPNGEYQIHLTRRPYKEEPNAYEVYYPDGSYERFGDWPSEDDGDDEDDDDYDDGDDYDDDYELAQTSMGLL